MVERPRSGDRSRRTSPWPVFVALGLALSEVGILFGSAAVGVGGLLLLAASVVGILRESRFTATRSRPALAVGVAFLALGAAVVGLTTADTRGGFLLAAGGLAALGGVGLFLHEAGRL